MGRIDGYTKSRAVPDKIVRIHARTFYSTAPWLKSGWHLMSMRAGGPLGLRARARWGPNFFLFRKSHPINVLRRKVGWPCAAKEMGSQLGRAAQLSMARHPRGPIRFGA